MRIYGETNFVLELVLEQSEVKEAEAIVELAKTHKVELVFRRDDLPRGARGRGAERQTFGR